MKVGINIPLAIRSDFIGIDKFDEMWGCGTPGERDTHFLVLSKSMKSERAGKIGLVVLNRLLSFVGVLSDQGRIDNQMNNEVMLRFC